MVFWKQKMNTIEYTTRTTMSTSVVNSSCRGGPMNNFPTNHGGGMMYHDHPHMNSQVIVQRRNKSPLKMPVTTAPVTTPPVPGGALPLYPRCSCCPFGYHIDLDFINYCQSLGNVDPSPGQKLRRDRRRQRQSMEIMLGFQQMDTLQMLPKVGEVIEATTPTATTVDEIEQKRSVVPPTTTATAKEKRLASAFANNALADVVQDFEKTLERSRTKSTSVERDSDREELEERRRTFDSRATTREKFFLEYEQNYSKGIAATGDQEAAGPTPLERNLSNYDNIDHVSQIIMSRKDSNGHNNNGLHRAKDNDLESVKSCASSSGGSEMSHGAMQYIREQMANSLSRIRDLEEHNKLIPQLQRELVRLKEEKRELEGKVQNLQHEKRTTRSPFSPQRVSPVQLQATAFNEMMQSKGSSATAIKAKLTREVGIQSEAEHHPPSAPAPPATSIVIVDSRTVSANTEKLLERNVTERLYTETEVNRMLQEEERKRQRKPDPIKDLRSVACQVVAAPEECAACKVHAEEKRQQPPKVITTPRGVQTDPPKTIATSSVAVGARPEVRSVGSSENSTLDTLVCDKCSVRKKNVGSGTERSESSFDGGVGAAESLITAPLSLKLLDQMASPGKSKSDVSSMTRSVEALMSTSQTSTCSASIGTQIGNTMRDAGCQSVGVVISNKSSQSDAVMVKGKGTDTWGLVECVDQGSMTEEEKGEERANENAAVPQKTTKSTNTIHIRTEETGANTDRVRQTDASVEVNTKEVEVQTKIVEVIVEVPAKLPKHVTIGCDNVGECVECHHRIQELAIKYGAPVEAPVLNATAEGRPQVLSKIPGSNPVNDSALSTSPGTSRIPRPSAMSPKTQRKPIAVLKRQDTYTVEEPIAAVKWEQMFEAKADKSGEEELPRDAVDEPVCIRKKEWVCGLKEKQALATDLIGLGVNNSSNNIGPDEEMRDSLTVKRTIPANDRPVSFVQELDESAQQSDDEEAEETEEEMTKRQTTPETVSKTTITSTTVLKNPKKQQTTPSTSSVSISEEDIRKELPNLPRMTARPSREMSGALKVINDSLMKSMDAHSLLNANTIVRREWFQVSSSEKADGLDVEDYLDCFEEYSNHLLRYMVNLTDANGNTAMHYAVSHGNFDIVSILLDSKVCHVNQMNNAGYTCVMLVSLVKLIETAHRHVVQRLFQMSDVNIKAKKHNQTALMLAVSHGNLDMVQILLEAGADINIQDEDGSTALMCAAEHGKIDIVKLLLAQQDCDSGVQDVDGSTALKIALDAGYRDIGILLYAHDHMSRHRSPHSTLPRKSKLSTASMTSSARFSPSASCPSSPAPSKKFFDQRK